MAKCFDLVGYNEPCNASRHVPTGRAMLFTAFATGVSGTISGQLTFSDNGMRITKFGRAETWSAAIDDYKHDTGNVFPISIFVQNPFAITIQGNTDNGRAMYHKTVHCSLFDTQDGKAEEFIQGMLKSKNAGMLVIEREGIEYADVFGAYDNIKIDPTTITRSEYENGGAWEFDLYCDEAVPNVGSSVPGIKQAIDTLLTA